MKRLFLILSLVGASLLNSSYAAGPTAESLAIQSFKTTYANASETVWQASGNFYKVSFVLNGEHRAAFFSADGELIAETKNVATTQLPAQLQQNLKKELGSMWVTEVFELTVDGLKQFYVRLEGAEKTVLLKSVGTKKWANYSVH